MRANASVRIGFSIARIGVIHVATSSPRRAAGRRKHALSVSSWRHDFDAWLAPERQAHAISRWRDPAHQQQAGDVRATDQQQEADRRRQRHQRKAVASGEIREQF